jgi:RNA polymerase sigma-70 factor (ECF subfamily)
MVETTARRVVSVALAELPDDDVIALAIEQDDRAFGELYRRYQRDIRDFCRRLVNDATRVEDLTQETFTRALIHMHRFRLGERFWPWLSTIARNVCIDELRSPRARAMNCIGLETERDEPAPRVLVDSTAEQVVRTEERRSVRQELSRAFAKLAPRDRRILWLHTVEEWSYDDIARADSSTVDAVRNVAWRARKYVRAMLEETRGIPVLLPGILLNVRRLFVRARMRIARVTAKLYAPGAEQLGDRGVALVASVGLIFAVASALTVGGSSGSPARARVVASSSQQDAALRRASASEDAARAPHVPGKSAARHTHTVVAGLPVSAETDSSQDDHKVTPKQTDLHIAVYHPIDHHRMAHWDDYGSCSGESHHLPANPYIDGWC